MFWKSLWLGSSKLDNRKKEEWPGLFSSICPYLTAPTVQVPSAEQMPLGAMQWVVAPLSSEHFPADAEACRNSQDTHGVFPGFQGRSSMLQHLTGMPLPVCTGLQSGSPPGLVRRGSSSANWPWGPWGGGRGMSRLLVSSSVSLQHNENGMPWERRA